MPGPEMPGKVHRALTGRWRQIAEGSVNRRIFSAAVIVAFLTGCVTLAILARELIVASTFGAGDAVDAFLIAFLLPTFLMNVIAGSMSAVFIPAYVHVKETEGHVEAQRLFSNITMLSAGLLVALALLLAVAGPYLLPILGSGFDPAKLLLTQQLFYILLPGIVLYGLVSICGAVLNASKRFALVAFAPALVPLMVIALLLVGRSWGITAMAVGTLAGYLIQLLTLGVALRRENMSLRPRWGVTHPAVKQVVRQYMPTVGASILMSSTIIVDQSLAATLGAGSVAALAYGSKLVVLILALGATAVRTAVLPYFSGMVARGEWPALRHTLKTYMSLILLATVPLVVALAVLAEPMVRLLFQRGAFTADSTALVSQIQAMYAFQVPFYILGSLVTPLISSLRENRVLLWSAAVSLSLDISLDLLFMRLFGVAGIALATSVVYTVSWVFITLFCYRIIRRREYVSTTL